MRRESPEHAYATRDVGAREGAIATFRVGVRVGIWGGGGQLWITTAGTFVDMDGSNAWTKTPRTYRVDDGGKVTLVRARLIPPWANTSVVFRTNEGVAYAATWFGARRALEVAFAAAGLEVQHVSTWFSPTGGRRTREELQVSRSLVRGNPAGAVVWAAGLLAAAAVLATWILGMRPWLVLICALSALVVATVALSQRRA